MDLTGQDLFLILTNALMFQNNSVWVVLTYPLSLYLCYLLSVIYIYFRIFDLVSSTAFVYHYRDYSPSQMLCLGRLNKINIISLFSS